MFARSGRGGAGGGTREDPAGGGRKPPKVGLDGLHDVGWEAFQIAAKAQQHVRGYSVGAFLNSPLDILIRILGQRGLSFLEKLCDGIFLKLFHATISLAQGGGLLEKVVQERG
jgi:hypothetical protein